MAERIRVASVDDLPDGGSTVVEVRNKDVAVFRVGDAYYAIDDLCPHAGASLAGGHVDCEAGTVTCPWHYWRFRLTDGAWADNPRVKTGCYAVRVEGEHVEIELPDRSAT